jgi:K+-transporting ATPase KdpF subunit
MAMATVLLLAITAGILGYLTYVILRPDRF